MERSARLRLKNSPSRTTPTSPELEALLNQKHEQNVYLAARHADRLAHHPNAVTSLQRVIGNRAVVQLLRAAPNTIQRNGKPIPPDDLKVLLHGAAVAAWKTFAFHASRTSAVEKPGGIAETGLDPAYGGTGAAKGNEQFEAQSRGKVHYTRAEQSAQGYKKFFETGEGFPGKTVEKTEPSEVLELSLPAEIVGGEARDKDDRQMAYTTTSAIPPQNIRRTKPVPVPAPGQQLDWKEHVAKGFAASAALVSNMPPDAQAVLERLTDQGYDPRVILKMLENALRANPATRFLTWDDLPQTLRAGRNDMSAMGTPVKLETT